jgi:hypothetical protein
MPLRATASWWSTFPWSSVGAVVALIGLAIAALRLAVLWGAAKQHVEDHERRLNTLESKLDGVPDEVDHEVSARYVAVQSESTMLRQNLTQMYRKTMYLQRVVDYIKFRCERFHGPPSKVVAIDDVNGDDDLILEPPRAAGDDHESKG